MRLQADLQSSIAVARRRCVVETESGKFARLRELAEVIAAKQEKILVFTQSARRPSDAAFLGHVFGREGVDSCMAARRYRSGRSWFGASQEDELFRSSFFLKSGGAASNLTAASHGGAFPIVGGILPSRIRQPIGRSGSGVAECSGARSSSVRALSRIRSIS